MVFAIENACLFLANVLKKHLKMHAVTFQKTAKWLFLMQQTSHANEDDLYMIIVHKHFVFESFLLNQFVIHQK